MTDTFDYQTPDKHGLVPNIHHAGKLYCHSGNHLIYLVTGFQWSGDDEWMIVSERAGSEVMCCRTLSSFFGYREPGVFRFEATELTIEDRQAQCASGDLYLDMKPSPAQQLKADTLTFGEELQSLCNRYSRENDSNTPDFILAHYLVDSLKVFNDGVNHRESWFGRRDNGVAIHNPNVSFIVHEPAPVRAQPSEAVIDQINALPDNPSEAPLSDAEAGEMIG